MQWPQSLRIQIGKEVRNEGAVSQSLEAAHATDLIVSLLIFEERSYWFFFFSSRRRHTISLCDWSSDVCSSDLTTVHTNSTGTHTSSGQGTTVANMSTGFHTYGVDWEASTTTFYFDGQQVYQTATPSDLNK